MENTSKALLIAAAVLIAIILIAVGIKIFSSASGVQKVALDTGTIMSEKTKRNSSIELMKVIAIVMIVLSHSMPDGDGTLGASYIDIDSVTTNWQ